MNLQIVGGQHTKSNKTTEEIAKGAEAVEKQPSGKELLEILIDLLAEQEGVKIHYEIRSNKNETDNNR